MAQWGINRWSDVNVPDQAIDQAFAGVAAIQAGQVAAVAGGEAALAGGQAVMNFARANPRVIEAATDFVSGANPSVTPNIVSKAGLAGWFAGQAYEYANSSKPNFSYGK